MIMDIDTLRKLPPDLRKKAKEEWLEYLKECRILIKKTIAANASTISSHKYYVNNKEKLLKKAKDKWKKTALFNK